MKKLIFAVLFLAFTLVTFKTASAVTVSQIVSKKSITLNDLKILNRLVDSKAHFTVADLRKLLRHYTGTASGLNSSFNSIGKTTIKIKKPQGNYNSNYLERYGYANGKKLAFFVEKVLKTYPNVYKNINEQGEHYQTVIYIAAARQMTHVLFFLLNDGYINPAITSLSNEKIFFQTWYKERDDKTGYEIIPWHMGAKNAAFPYQVYQENKNNILSAYINKKLRKMTEYLLWCKTYVSSGIDSGECFKYSKFAGKNSLDVYFPEVGPYPKYIPYYPYKPTAAMNPYKKWKPANITNNPKPAGYWASINRW